MIDIVVHNRTKVREYGESFFHRIADAVAPYIRAPKGVTIEIGISLVGPARMRALNRTHRQKDASTDVLSFPLHMSPIKGYTSLSLGDIFISLPDVAAKATQSGNSVREQMAWTTVHGLLHLAGYDHERGPAAAKKMFALEQTILTSLSRVPTKSHHRH